MRTIFAIFILIAALTFGHHYSHAASVYPSVQQLENELGYRPGAPIMDRGIWRVSYVRSHALGNGEYAVIVRLDRNR